MSYPRQPLELVIETETQDRSRGVTPLTKRTDDLYVFQRRSRSKSKERPQGVTYTCVECVLCLYLGKRPRKNSNPKRTARSKSPNGKKGIKVVLTLKHQQLRGNS